MEALILLEGIVILLLVVLVAGLLRSHAEILRQLDALGGGEHRHQITPPRRQGGTGTVQSIVGMTPAGGSATVALSGSRGHTLLAFLSTTCTACSVFWRDELADFGGIRPVIVAKGPDAESPAAVAGLAPSSLATVMSTEAWEVFAVPATPYFVLVDNSAGRVIGEGAAANWERVADMMRRALADDRHALRRSTGKRKADVDEELVAAGIEPGDPRLYEPPIGGPK